jgi:hypothetical protein
VRALIVIATVLLASCGGGPTTPITPKPPVDVIPPVNALPTIDAITIQGRRAKQPPRFADARETVDVVATVRDAETPIDELTYQWTATAGTFSGTGRAVTWTAPDTVPAPVIVTMTLKIVENYGHPGQPKNYSHDVSATQTLDLHDSVREVGEMSRQFLLDFSDTNLKIVDVIMRNFGTGARCPEPSEVASERSDVTTNFTYFDMKAFSVGQPSTTITFGGLCTVPDGATKGDACSVVPVMWDSVDTRTGKRGSTSGLDIVSAAYSAQDTRWWLCSSRYRATSTDGAARFIR